TAAVVLAAELPSSCRRHPRHSAIDFPALCGTRGPSSYPIRDSQVACRCLLSSSTIASNRPSQYSALRLHR
ncbi:hypothetical protein S83_038387, partial [Arachis hypogaea]